MNKTKTALLYFPDSTPKVAVRHLMRWIAPVRTIAPRPGSHRIPSLSEILHLPPVATRLPPPGRTVIPPGICHRLSENSSSLFERGLRGKNKEGSVKSALKSPHDASAGRVPGQFPQRVKKGSEGVTPHGREVIFAVSEGRSRTPAQDYKNPGTRFRGSCTKFHRTPQQCAPCSYLTLFR